MGRINRNGNLKYVDLHMHTTFSDGTDDGRSLVRACKLKGIEIMAITDHDILEGYFQAIDEAEKWGIELIPGVEVSTEGYHILGLNVNPYDQDFRDFLANVRKLQKSNTIKRVNILKEHGVPMSIEKLDRAFPNSRVGRYNIFMAMMQDSECEKYFGKTNPGLSPNDVYNLYLRKGGLASEIEHKEEISPKDAIDAIHIAGGVAIIAHPFKDVKSMTELDRLREYGLDGLEIQPNYGERNDEFREYAVKHCLLMSYGSDYHGPSMNRYLLGRGENLVDKDKLLNKCKEVVYDDS